VTDQPSDALIRRHAETALAQVQRLSRLVDDLLDASRLQSGKLTLDLHPVRLNELLVQTVALAQMMTAGQTIIFNNHKTSLVVQGDTDRLQQVILNLLINAITYAPNTERIEVHLNSQKGEAEIRMKDYGTGMSAADMRHLFSRFYQVARSDRPSRRGLGLGLFISKEIVEVHGGSISVDSTEGRGSTFIVRLPLAHDAAPKG